MEAKLTLVQLRIAVRTKQRYHWHERVWKYWEKYYVGFVLGELLEAPLVEVFMNREISGTESTRKENFRKADCKERERGREKKARKKERWKRKKKSLYFAW